jgi:hypothetical protein
MSRAVPKEEEERDKLIDNATQGWEQTLQSLNEGNDPTFAFLTLAKQDLVSAATTVDCQYCRKHILEEVKLIDMTIELAKLGNAYQHTHGAGEKLRIASSAARITGYIALGGMKRAGFIR